MGPSAAEWLLRSGRVVRVLLPSLAPRWARLLLLLAPALARLPAAIPVPGLARLQAVPTLRRRLLLPGVHLCRLPLWALGLWALLVLSVSLLCKKRTRTLLQH